MEKAYVVKSEDGLFLNTRNGKLDKDFSIFKHLFSDKDAADKRRAFYEGSSDKMKNLIVKDLYITVTEYDV